MPYLPSPAVAISTDGILGWEFDANPVGLSIILGYWVNNPEITLGWNNPGLTLGYWVMRSATVEMHRFGFCLLRVAFKTSCDTSPKI